MSATGNMGWTALPRGAWQAPEVLELIGSQPNAATLYLWLHSVLGRVSGLFTSTAVDLAGQLASLGGFEREAVASALAELERRGLVLCERGCLYVPACMRETCAAPSSKNQLPSWCRQIEQLGPRLREQATRDLLDVTARADVERVKRRKAGVEPLFERLKTALGVGLYSVPELPQELDPQLELPFAAPRPEMRIVKTEDLDEQALCMLALIGDQSESSAQNEKASSHRPRVDGAAVVARHDAVGLFDGAHRVASPTAARVDAPILAGSPAGVRQQIGVHDGEAKRESGSGRPLAAERGHAIEHLRHVAGQTVAGGAAGSGARPRDDAALRALPPRQQGRAADAHAGADELSAGLRADPEGARARLERFVDRSRDPDGVARLLMARIDEASVYLFDEGRRRIGATDEDLDKMAALLASGEEWGHARGMQLRLWRKPYLVGAPDHAAELLIKARTPVRKPQGRGGVGAFDELNPSARFLFENVAAMRTKGGR